MKKTKKSAKQAEQTMPNEVNYEMGDIEMEDLLVELSGTKFWTAIKRYANGRDGIITSYLSTADPFKEPTMVARYQGLRSGLFDMIEGVSKIREERQETMKNQEQESQKAQ